MGLRNLGRIPSALTMARMGARCALWGGFHPPLQWHVWAQGLRLWADSIRPYNGTYGREVCVLGRIPSALTMARMGARCALWGGFHPPLQWHVWAQGLRLWADSIRPYNGTYGREVCVLGRIPSTLTMARMGARCALWVGFHPPLQWHV